MSLRCATVYGRGSAPPILPLLGFRRAPDQHEFLDDFPNWHVLRHEDQTRAGAACPHLRALTSLVYGPKSAKWRVEDRTENPILITRPAAFSQFRSDDWQPPATSRTGVGGGTILSAQSTTLPVSPGEIPFVCLGEPKPPPEMRASHRLGNNLAVGPGTLIVSAVAPPPKQHARMRLHTRPKQLQGTLR